MDTSILEDLGLSKGEIKIYLVLLELGSTKIGRIIEKSGMASSAVHNAVNYLIDKGLVSYVKKGKIKHYQPVPPKQLIEFIEEKKNKILSFLPELELKHRLSGEKQEAEIFEGTRGIISLLNLLIEDTSPEEDYIFFAIDTEEKNEDVQKFMLNYDLKRKERKLKVRGLAPIELKKLFKKRNYLKMKYPPFPILSNLSICQNKIAIFSWDEKPIGYLIHSEQIARKYKEYFEKIWKIV